MVVRSVVKGGTQCALTFNFMTKEVMVIPMVIRNICILILLRILIGVAFAMVNLERITQYRSHLTLCAAKVRLIAEFQASCREWLEDVGSGNSLRVEN